jgi:hypothetical protein
MKGFRTLLWLEFRRNGVWAAALIGSLAFWAWGLFQVRFVEVAEQLEVRGILLLLASAIGAVVLALMIGRIRSETRGGQYQVLLLTPPSGYVHIAARYAFALATAAIYYIAIAGLAWWTIAMSRIPLDAGSIAQLTLAVPFYGLGISVMPLLAWTLLLMVFIAAYRVSGPGWIPGTVMVLGTPFALRWLIDGIVRVSYWLPGWHLFGGLEGAIRQAAQSQSEGEFDAVAVLPQEPLWIMLTVTVVLLAIAGRIWQEVEG